MNTKAEKKTDWTKLSDNKLKQLVEQSIKDKEPFAEKIETIKGFLDKVKISAL